MTTFRALRKALAAVPTLEHTTSGMQDDAVMRALGEDGKPPEGLFFPDTYLFGKGTRDIDLLRQSRERMRQELADRDPERFDLKQGTGGIADIEFMVQYAVLAWSHRLPGLARWSDNVRILETLGREGLFEQQQCKALTEAYIAYRSAAHQLSLQQQPGIVPAERFVDLRAAVTSAWRVLFTPAAPNE